MQRVPIDQIEKDEDYLVYKIWEFARFTGVAFETSSTGTVIYEVEYLNGIQEGMERTWYPSGQLREEREYRRNMAHGWTKDYDEAGTLISERLFEFGIQVEARYWTPTGESLGISKIDSDDPEYSMLETLRKAKWASD